VLAAGLRRLKLTPAQLKARRRGDPDKLKLAQELRAHTTVSLGWIAEHLSMGSRGYPTVNDETLFALLTA
jgi:hypothetical protein